MVFDRANSRPLGATVTWVACARMAARLAETASETSTTVVTPLVDMAASSASAGSRQPAGSAPGSSSTVRRARSEERRVGKEGVSTWRARRPRYHEQQKTKNATL